MANKSSATRRIVLILGGLVLLLALLGGGAYAAGWVGGGPSGVKVDVAEAGRRDLTQVVTAFGRAQPEVEVAISPDVSGEIVELSVTEGDQVTEGDLLVRLRPDNIIAQVEQAQAGVSQAQANLAEAKADSIQRRFEFERQEQLYERNVISEADFQTAQTAYERAVARLQAARYQVQSAQAQLRDTRERLAQTRVYAPMSGTVSVLNVELGERVVGTTQMAGTEMMRIARLDQMELVVDVNENDIVNVALEDTAAIEIDAYPDRAFDGKVTEIANSARISGEGTQEQVTNFPVKVRVMEPHNQDLVRTEGGALAQGEVTPPPTETLVLRPGMSGTVDIFTQTVPNAIAVPIQAVTVRDFNKVGTQTNGDGDGITTAEDEDLRKVVFIADADSARMVEVTTGISDDTHIEIRSGLDGGERVIVGPYRAVSRELEPGSAVQVKGGPDANDDGEPTQVADAGE